MAKRVRVSLILVSCGLLVYAAMGAVLSKSQSSSDTTYRDLGVYSEVLSRIQQDYVTKPSLKKVTRGAIRGLLSALDPYSTYFTAKEYQDYLAHPKPGPGKIGIYVSKRMGYTTIVSILPGSPAAQAGIEPGDLLDTLEDRPTRGLSVVQLNRILDGAPGTTVHLSVIRGDRGAPLQLALTREILPPPPVEAKMVDGHTAYLHVLTFNPGKTREIAAKLKQLIAQGSTQIVLDLRDCAGGSEKEGEETANLFLNHGLITYLAGQRFPRKNIMAEPSNQITQLPLVVLTNMSTAGPAEIVAAAILDNHRGDVVGERTFGVGVYQQMIPVGDGSALLLSVAKYYTPNGQQINGYGVTPNVIQPARPNEVSLNPQPFPPSQMGGKNDLQFQRALEILDQKSSTAKVA
jgi:carboxyl-terminal processing protease